MHVLRAFPRETPRSFGLIPRWFSGRISRWAMVREWKGAPLSECIPIKKSELRYTRWWCRPRAVLPPFRLLSLGPSIPFTSGSFAVRQGRKGGKSEKEEDRKKPVPGFFSSHYITAFSPKELEDRASLSSARSSVFVRYLIIQPVHVHGLQSKRGNSFFTPPVMRSRSIVDIRFSCNVSRFIGFIYFFSSNIFVVVESFRYALVVVECVEIN